MTRIFRSSRIMGLSVTALLAFGFLTASAQQTPAVQAAKPETLAAKPTKPAKPKSTPSDAGNLGLGSHDSNAPIDITADNFDYDLNVKIGTYTGNVIVIQGDMRMRSDKMKVNIVQGKPTQIEAFGHVVVIAPNGNATGDHGVYDPGPRTITLTGKVVLTKEKDVMHGTKLVMDMNTNVAHMYAQGMPGGRVQSLFIPPPKKAETGTGAAPAKKTGKAASKPAATATPVTDPPPQ
jgi:lipopolysaccharide export system protein LptA